MLSLTIMTLHLTNSEYLSRIKNNMFRREVYPCYYTSQDTAVYDAHPYYLFNTLIAHNVIQYTDVESCLHKI